MQSVHRTLWRTINVSVNSKQSYNESTNSDVKRQEDETQSNPWDLLRRQLVIFIMILNYFDRKSYINSYLLVNIQCDL